MLIYISKRTYTLCCTIAFPLSHLIIFSFVYEHRIDSECTYKTNGMPLGIYNKCLVFEFVYETDTLSD